MRAEKLAEETCQLVTSPIHAGWWQHATRYRMVGLMLHIRGWRYLVGVVISLGPLVRFNGVGRHGRR